jgi:drug/metabolite transporter (DMT)-like permease
MKIVLAYVAIVAIWTTTPLAIKWSGQTDWFFGVAARTALGALLILPIVWWWSTARFEWHWSAIRVYLAASLPLLGGMTSMYWAAQYLPSGWIAILFALTPVMTGILAHYCLPDSRLTLKKSLGVLISLAGLLIIFAPNLKETHAHLQLMAIALALLSVAFHSYGTVLVKRLNSTLPALHVVAGALWVTFMGHFLMAPNTLLEWPELATRESLAIVYAATVGSVLGFLLYFYLLKNVGAIKVALIPVITPVFALLLGHWLNHETLNATVWLGAGLVILGLIVFEWRFGARWRKPTL